SSPSRPAASSRSSNAAWARGHRLPGRPRNSGPVRRPVRNGRHSPGALVGPGGRRYCPASFPAASTDIAMARTLYDKIWDAHLVHQQEDGTAALYIDLHLIHEVTSPQAFEGLRLAGRTARRPDKTLAVVDHNVPTTADRLQGVKNEESRIQIDTLAQNAAEF